MRAASFLMIVLLAGVVLAADSDPNRITPTGAPNAATPFEPIPDLGTPPGQPVPGYESDPGAALKSVEGLFGQDINPEPVRDGACFKPTKDIDVTETGWVRLSSVGLDSCLGLDYVTNVGDNLSCSHPIDDTLYFLNIDTMAVVDSWATDPTNLSNFGNTVYYGMYLNDWNVSNYFFGNGSGWTPYVNPGGTRGRGMDCDYTHTGLIWQAHSDGGVHNLVAFTPGASTGTWYDISNYIPAQMSGLAVFDSEGRTGIAITCYQAQSIFFFEFDGVDIVYLGSRGLPWSSVTDSSLGLAYSASTGLFYYSFTDTLGAGFISKLSVDMRAIFEDDFERGDTVDWACAGQCSGGYTQDCDPSTPCFCFTTTEGYGVCIDDFYCSNPSCTSSLDCRPGYVCVTCSGCGPGTCARRECTDGGPNPLDGAGMTAGGR